MCRTKFVPIEGISVTYKRKANSYLNANAKFTCLIGYHISLSLVLFFVEKFVVSRINHSSIPKSLEFRLRFNTFTPAFLTVLFTTETLVECKFATKKKTFARAARILVRASDIFIISIIYLLLLYFYYSLCAQIPSQ